MDRGISNLFTSGGSYYNPVWSPDGRKVMLNSSRPPQGLFIKNVSGAGGEERVTQASNPQSTYDWSADGRFILFGETGDLWILPMAPEGKPAQDRKPIPYLRTPFHEWRGRFSSNPAPRWIAYDSDESGRREVYIDTFPERRSKTRISTSGGIHPEWGPGGRELFYVSLDYKLIAVSLKLTVDSAKPAVPRELFALPAVETSFSPYQVAPDGQRFLVRAAQERETTLNLIVNWPALLKKGSSAP
jgi:eukaryotic-like serine/threonine-protein kinase